MNSRTDSRVTMVLRTKQIVCILAMLALAGGIFVYGGCAKSSVSRTAPHARLPVSSNAQLRGLPAKTPAIEILFVRQTSDSSKWQICILQIPSGKVEVLATSVPGMFIDTAIGVHLCPSGQYVALTALHNKGGRKGALVSDLVLLDRKSKSLRYLTKDGQGYDSILWSPDGRHISAHGLRGWVVTDMPPTDSMARHDDLFVWDVQTGSRRRVASDANIESWSPDGTSLLSISATGTARVWNASTSRSQIISEVGDANATAWAHDSRMLVYAVSGDTDLYGIRPGDKPITVGKHIAGQMSAPAFSPKDTELAYADRIGLPDEPTTSGLWILSLTNGRKRKLSESEAVPMWSPDGTKIAICAISPYAGNDPHTSTITVLDSATGESAALLALPGDAWIQGWTSDSRMIVLKHTSYKFDTKASDGCAVEQPVRVILLDAANGSVVENRSLPVMLPYVYAFYESWRPASGLREY